MTEHLTAAAKLPILGGFGSLILKRILEEIEQMTEAALEKKVVAGLHKGGHDLPAAPTDADKQAFVRHCVRQFFHGLPVVGHALADPGRDFFTPRISPTVLPQLAPGTTTQAGAHAVGQALIADVTGLVGGL